MPELLVVIGIIIVIAGLLLPTINRAVGKASRTAAQADLAAIGAALEAYKADFGDYPRVRLEPTLAATAVPPEQETRPNPPSGAQILCQALYGPAPAVEQAIDATKRSRQDGADGLGFRIRPQGRVYLPYLPTDRFRIGIDSEPENHDLREHCLRMTIIDRYNKAVLYFPANPAKPSIRANYAARSELAYYDLSDNIFAISSYTKPVLVTQTTAEKTFRAFMGDDSQDGIINGTEQGYELPYLLWSAGPDELYGPQATMAIDEGVLDARDAAVCDDVTNFRINNR